MSKCLVRCTIEMELVEGRDFTLKGRHKKEYIITRAEDAFVEQVFKMINDDTIWEYVQAKIIEEPT